ncbi:MAG: hypothetical protein JNN15_15435 [Blastocatellia bacterium]|nr:hypothetical protein [Blastocatellia bacterium]
MDESMEKLLKELTQKRLRGGLTAEEELLLDDLVKRKQESMMKDLPSIKISSNLSPLDKLMNDTLSLGRDMEDMAAKVRQRSNLAESKYDIGQQNKKKQD